MRAVVLVGGEGTRLRPLTLTTPKQMLPIVEQPMIERVIGHLADHGIDDAVLSLGYRPDAFINAYPGGTIAGVRLTYAVEPTPLDTAGAIRFAARTCRHRRHLRGGQRRRADRRRHLGADRLPSHCGAEATISLTPVDDPSAFGVVPTDARRAGSRPSSRSRPGTRRPTNLINAGTYVFEPSVLDRIPDDRRVSIERETFPGPGRGGPLFALGSDAYWLDTGTPDAYLRAHRDLLLGRRPGPPGPRAELDPASAPASGASVTSRCRAADRSWSLLGPWVSVPGSSVGPRRCSVPTR